jgi:hypothetical protein
MYKNALENIPKKLEVVIAEKGGNIVNSKVVQILNSTVFYGHMVQ